MSLTSLSFAALTGMALIGYYWLPRRLQNAWLLGVSIVYLGAWSWASAALLVGLGLVNYGAGRAMHRTDGPQRWLFILGLAVNVLVLVHFRLADFYVPQALALAARLGLPPLTPSVQILIPVGVSYYTLQAISYLVDVYRRVCPASSSVVDFLLYQAYFPKLLAGPIERARVFLPRLAQPRPLNGNLVARGLTLILLGLVRKLVIADALARLIPATAFYQPGDFTGPELLVFLVAYGFALYNDFAGYTSLARGVSGLFGLELTPNFNLPYYSRTFNEFWNRWHISLSHWLRDYIYFPLSRMLAGRFPDRTHWLHVVVPPMATMLVSGLWHATWTHRTIVVWGVLHGVYLTLERVAARNGPVVSPDQWPRWRQIGRAGIVLGLVLLAWVPFREGSHLSIVLDYWAGLIRWSHWRTPDTRILLVLVFAVALDWIQARERDEVVFRAWPRPAKAALLAATAILLILSLPLTQAAPFVYQGF